MKRGISCFISVSIVSFVMLIFVGPTIVEADPNLNRLLRGDYAFTATNVCMNGNIDVLPGGGDLFEPPPSLRARGFAGQLIRVNQGTLRYNGDGTGQVTALELLILREGGPGSSPVRQQDLNCTLTYQVHPERRFTQAMNCSGTRLAGVNADVPESVTFTNIMHEGQISLGRQVLVFGNVGVNLEGATGSVVGDFQQICGRSGTAVKMHSLPSEGGEDG